MICIFCVHRPAAAVTTPMFGQQWTQPSMAEAVISIPGSTAKTPQQFVSALQESLHMHPIEIIAASMLCRAALPCLNVVAL
jgi:hypothetical protein